MKIFISYSSLNINIARNIKTFLDDLNIDSFLANDDIRSATDWKQRITDELKECNAIIPILSKNFKNSDWCSQELGIFYYQKKVVIPISMDRSPSYGFINHIQARCVKDMALEYIISEGLVDNFSLFTGFLVLLNRLNTYARANTFFNILKPYNKKIKKNDLNYIIEESIKNDQIWAAGGVKDNLNKLIKERKEDIKPELLVKIIYQLRYKRKYKK